MTDQTDVDNYFRKIFSENIKLKAEIERLRALMIGAAQVTEDNQAKIKQLRAALEPFASDVDAVTLGDALWHITREDLHRARDALK
jgi:hypothetical protein